MISRRQLIGSGVAASALGLAVPAISAIESRAARAANVTFLLVDERFDAVRSLARTLGRKLAPGARHIAMPRDVLELWHRDLEPACLTGTQAIAGITTERGFFLLSTLAADQRSGGCRLRVLSRATHGALVSWVIGPK